MLQDRIRVPFALTERLCELPSKLTASRPIVQTGKLRLGEEKGLSPWVAAQGLVPQPFDTET